MEIQQLPDPQPREGEVLLQVSAAGVCGSDLHGFLGHSERRKPGLVMGHEAVATILDLHPSVSGWRRGQRVCFNPLMSCGSVPCVPGGAPEPVSHVDGLRNGPAARRLCRARRGAGASAPGALGGPLGGRRRPGRADGGRDPRVPDWARRSAARDGDRGRRRDRGPVAGAREAARHPESRRRGRERRASRRGAAARGRPRRQRHARGRGRGGPRLVERRGGRRRRGRGNGRLRAARRSLSRRRARA